MKKLYEVELLVKQLKQHDTLKISIIYTNSLVLRDCSSRAHTSFFLWSSHTSSELH